MEVETMLILKLTTIPKDEFNIAACSEAYDDFLADHHEVPDAIHIKAWQRFVLTGGPDPENPTWRGVPLKVV